MSPGLKCGTSSIEYFPGASKWKFAPSLNTRSGTYVARTPGVPARSHATARALSDSQNSVYQLQIGGWVPIAPPTAGIPEPQPTPSGDSTTTPMLASVIGAVWPSSVDF